MSETYKIDGAKYIEMIRCGAVNLRNNAQTVNELNVFPIPDGDTGENMSRTVEGGVAAAKDLSSPDISSAAKAMSDGMLLSARGNSGVILSQFFEGIKRGFDGVKEADVPAFKKAMEAGVKQAYSAVVQPTEGTILTVMREAAAKAASVSDDAPLELYFEEYIEEMYASLDRTPDLLPVLKEAGVLDSGGAGLVYIFEGMNRALRGDTVEKAGEHIFEAAATSAADSDAFTEDSKMQFGYCTEVILQLMNSKTDAKKYDVNELIKYLESIGGESIVAFKTGTRIKMHVHTFEPNKVLAYALGIGELVAVKIENMAIQHTGAVVRNRFERQSEKGKKKERTKYACVTVADGEGLIAQFKELGADYVIDGKQTMNPSTNDFIKAFEEVNADTVFVLPNNSNIILAANQAAALYKKSRIVVIASSTLAEGFSALSMHDYSSDNVDEIAGILTDAVSSVTTGLVTYSIRDCKLGGRPVKKGDWIGFVGKELLSSSDKIDKCATELLSGVDMTDKSVVIAIRGKSGAADADIAAVGKYMAEHHPDMEFFELDGGQDVYSIIFVIE